MKEQILLLCRVQMPNHQKFFYKTSFPGKEQTPHISCSCLDWIILVTLVAFLFLIGLCLPRWQEGLWNEGKAYVAYEFFRVTWLQFKHFLQEHITNTISESPKLTMHTNFPTAFQVESQFPVRRDLSLWHHARANYK